MSRKFYWKNTEENLNWKDCFPPIHPCIHSFSLVLFIYPIAIKAARLWEYTGESLHWCNLWSEDAMGTLLQRVFIKIIS